MTIFFILSFADVEAGRVVPAHVVDAPNAREALIKVREDVGPGDFYVAALGTGQLLRVETVTRLEVLP